MGSHRTSIRKSGASMEKMLSAPNYTVILFEVI